MNGRWASFVILFLSTLALGVWATEFHAKPFSAILISALYGIAYIINSVAYGLDLFRKEQRLLHRVGYHGLVFFRGSEVESSEREKAEKLFIRQTSQGDVGKFVLVIVISLCLGAAFLIRKKAPDQLQWSTGIHFISIAILAASFSMNHYFLSLAINAAAVFIFVSQRIQDPQFSFFQSPSTLLPMCYVIFLFGFTGVFYRFLEFFQFGFELRNVRKLMKQGWVSGVIFLLTLFLFNALVPDRKPGAGTSTDDQTSENRSLKVVQSIDRSIARWVKGGIDPIDYSSPVTTTTTGTGGKAQMSAEEKVLQGLKESLRRQSEEMVTLKKQMAEAEAKLDKLKSSPLSSGESQADRFKKIQELQEKVQALQGEVAGRENRVADLEKHIAQKQGHVPASDPSNQNVSAGLSGASGIDPEKEKRDIEELKKKIAEMEAAQARAKAEAEALEARRKSAANLGSNEVATQPAEPPETPEALEARLERERETQESLAQMKKEIEKKEARIRQQEEELKNATLAKNQGALTAKSEVKAGDPLQQVPNEEKQKELKEKIRPPEQRILSDAQLEMILKVMQLLFFGGVAIGLAFAVMYFLNRKSAADKERNIYQAAVEDPERYQKELKFLDQKGLTPQQEVILKYNLFLRFLKSVHMPKEDWQTVDQFHGDLIRQKSYDSATLVRLCDVFGRVCYGGHRPDAQEVAGFRDSLEKLITEMTLQFKRELTAQAEAAEEKAS
ncbi:MAG: hypothetical protein K2X47_17415 [Bdellovibrionales bacterium]|nr:hypothetical protein [Bdellovibrionales bacterium]